MASRFKFIASELFDFLWLFSLSLAIVLGPVLWLCVDPDPQNQMDYSTIPSIFGAGAYLAWAVTLVDLYWSKWAALLSAKFTGHEPDANESPMQIRVIQIVTASAYVIICFGWMLFPVNTGTMAQKIAAIETFSYLGRTLYLINLRYDFIYTIGIWSLFLFPGSWVRMNGEWDACYVWLGLFCAILILLPVGLTFFTEMQFGDIKIVTVIFHVVLYSIYELLYQKHSRSLPLRLRAPWPKTQYGLGDLDQAFAFGLALACFIIPRCSGLWTKFF